MGDLPFVIIVRGFELMAPEGKALMTASGGNFISAFLNRNKRSPQCGVAPIEVAGSNPPVGAKKLYPFTRLAASPLHFNSISI